MSASATVETWCLGEEGHSGSAAHGFTLKLKVKLLGDGICDAASSCTGQVNVGSWIWRLLSISQPSFQASRRPCNTTKKDPLPPRPWPEELHHWSTARYAPHPHQSLPHLETSTPPNACLSLSIHTARLHHSTPLHTHEWPMGPFRERQLLNRSIGEDIIKWLRSRSAAAAA